LVKKFYFFTLFSIAGVSRSSSICIAYLMKSNSWTYEKALEYIQSTRNEVNPNQGFVKQLKDYQNEIGCH
jgi:protein-tyrosine phosphatase